MLHCNVQALQCHYSQMCKKVSVCVLLFLRLADGTFVSLNFQSPLRSHGFMFDLLSFVMG